MAEQQNQQMTEDVEYNLEMIQTRDKAEFAATLNAGKRFFYQASSVATVAGATAETLGFTKETPNQSSEGSLTLPANIDKNVNIVHEMQAKGENAKILSWDNMLPQMNSVAVLQANSFGLVDPDNPVVQEMESNSAKYSEEQPVASPGTEVFDEAVAPHKSLEALSSNALDYVMNESEFKEAMENTEAYLVMSADDQNLSPMYESTLGEATSEADQAMQHMDDVALDAAIQSENTGRGYEPELEAIVNAGQENTFDREYGT